ncbi:MAG: hypothetical protein ACC707_15195 [Thiohalomonadales bacterium]
MNKYLPGLLLLMPLFLMLLLAACNNERIMMPIQEWQGISFEVETRPPKAVAGMNEFVIIASRGRRPVADVILSIKIMGPGEWKQAIQDGHVGVFRKSILVKNPLESSLLVRIRHSQVNNKSETILEFPLRQQSIPAN